MKGVPPPAVRALIIVLGDQLDPDAAAFDGFDPAHDAVWMAEVAEESTHVLSGKARIAMFLAAMRHFALELRERGRSLHYVRLDDHGNQGTLAAELQAAIGLLRPQRLVMTEAGDWRVQQELRAVAAATGIPLEVRVDRHFFTTVEEFRAYARGRKAVRLEYFYRELRRRHAVLMEGGQPRGGQWNYDRDNRAAFGAQGPGWVPPPAVFAPDAMTHGVLELVERHFASHPGSLDGFAWPVTRAQALESLAKFIAERLPLFGRFQDAMWTDAPWLYHSHLAALMNLKLLQPREVVAAATAALDAGDVAIADAEGFIRQVLGWREFVRGVYWTAMPGYADLNVLEAHEPLPAWYWTAQTDMACLRAVIAQTLATGYAHHIQRLMVTGLFALLFGVEPRQVHAWYLAMYVDAVEWVEMPNTLGMSQYADGGMIASKPYIASGKYIERMSNYCRGCRYRPAERLGERACPFTTLYWDFLLRHGERFAANPRLALQVRSAGRMDSAEREAVLARAAAIRRSGGCAGHD